jgi:aliphatic nitrilase
MEVSMRHHALEAGCFVVNATAWLSDQQIAGISADPALQKACRGGCYTAIISPEGTHLAAPLREGEGMVLAELDFALITKRKRMMDSVGHYARPELLSLNLDARPAAPLAARPASHDQLDLTPGVIHERSDPLLPVAPRPAARHRDAVAGLETG